MLCDMVHHHQEQLTILLPQSSKEHFSRSPSAQSFHLFPETPQDNSASSSNGGNEGYSSNHLSVSCVLYNNITTTNNNQNTDDLSLVFNSPGEVENDTVSASTDYFNHSTNYTIPQFSNNQQQFDLSSLNNQNFHEANDIITNNSLNPHYNNNIIGPPASSIVMTTSSLLTHSCEDESLAITFVPSYTQMNPTIHSYNNLPNSAIGTYMSPTLPIANNPINLTMPASYHLYDYLSQQDINFPTTISSVFDDLEVHTNNDNRRLMEGHSSLTPSISLEIDESSSFKVDKLSVEERKEKINKYMKKRNQRNFSKKIKYACRKTLADSRPRIRGRFVKNEDLIEATTSLIITPHQEYTYQNNQMVLKEEEDLVVSYSDIFGDLNSVNPFNGNSLYQSQHWT